DDYIILIVARAATVPDLAYIFQHVGADFAMNLDGGGSVALSMDGSYRVGPGRLLPNAIVFVPK
ncbi:MAG: phosphodiester glycosidase family protein, partial [Patescibacteria group bacterium]